jgi:hypothetical protein
MERYRHFARLFFRTLLALGLSACSTAAFTQQPEGAQSVSIEQLLGEVQNGLTQAQTKLVEDKLPPLKSVTLNLTAEAKDVGGGKVNLFIVSFGRQWEKSVSQEIEIKLVPPKADKRAGITKGITVADQLATAIVSAGKSVRNARDHGGVPLVTSSLKVVLSFVVKQDTSGGAQLKLVPVTFDLSGEMAKEATQKITVEYE